MIIFCNTYPMNSSSLIFLVHTKKNCNNFVQPDVGRLTQAVQITFQAKGFCHLKVFFVSIEDIE